MKSVCHLLFLLFCFGFVELVLSGVLAHAQPPGGGKPPTQADLNEVLQKLDAVSCAASGFIDNLDGTLCDCVRDLMWEKKTGTVGDPVNCTSAGVCPDPHDVNNRYTWSSTGTGPDGTLFTVFLAQLNGEIGGMGCFAGHCDWRIPEVGQDGGVPELEAILDLSKGLCGGGIGPCINPIFGATAASNYWSSTTNANGTLNAWGVNFALGSVGNFGKSLDSHARAVRPCM